MLSELIQALQIILKYGDTQYPTNCVHDALYVFPAQQVSEEDIIKLEALGFIPDDDIVESFISYKFGSN